MERSWAGGTSRALRINAMLLLLQMEMLEVSANVSRRQEHMGPGGCEELLQICIQWVPAPTYLGAGSEVKV